MISADVKATGYCKDCPFMDLTTDTFMANEQCFKVLVRCQNEDTCRHLYEYLKKQIKEGKEK